MKMKTMIIDFILALFSLFSSNSDAPSNRHGHVLVATLDGTVSFVDQELQTTLWSVKTGGPIYSSYQAPEINIKGGDNSYMDCGDDWDLYKHDSIKGTAERHSRANDLIGTAEKLSEGTTYVRGNVLPSTTVVDAHSGAVLRRLDFSSGLDGFTEPGFKGKLERVKKIVIIRNDYSFSGFSTEFFKTLWNVSLAEFRAYSVCPEAEVNSSCESGDIDVKRVSGGLFEKKEWSAGKIF